MRTATFVLLTAIFAATAFAQNTYGINETDSTLRDTEAAIQSLERLNRELGRQPTPGPRGYGEPTQSGRDLNSNRWFDPNGPETE